LLLSSDDAPYLFSSLKRIVLDELHALVTSKRGDLSLGLARLWRLAPQATTVGLSATVAEPDDLRRYLMPQADGTERMADLVIADAALRPLSKCSTPRSDCHGRATWRAMRSVKSTI
jgi:ATP-dependent Lhr-like helicase